MGLILEFQATYTIEDYASRMDFTVTDADIEKMMMRLVSETREMLGQNSNLLMDLARALAAAGSLKTEAVAVLAQQHGLDVVVKEEGYLHIPNYDQQLMQPLNYVGNIRYNCAYDPRCINSISERVRRA